MTEEESQRLREEEREMLWGALERLTKVLLEPKDKQVQELKRMF